MLNIVNNFYMHTWEEIEAAWTMTDKIIFVEQTWEYVLYYFGQDTTMDWNFLIVEGPYKWMTTRHDPIFI